MLSAGEKAVGDSSQKTKKSTFLKPYILVPAIMTGVAGIIWVWGLSIYFHRKKAKKAKQDQTTKAQTEVEKKMAATVPVSFARGRKAKASARPNPTNPVAKPRHEPPNMSAVPSHPEPQNEKATLCGDGGYAETTYENSTVCVDTVDPET
eukprot:GHVT01006200.1.p1 GENE.GHVT01006200.1~~GHVT01006200.1.p1  ORF type:complete len:150 (-),score=22.48 GHVT01006200.1:692-1141(-)